MPSSNVVISKTEDLYLDLLSAALTRSLLDDQLVPLAPAPPLKRAPYKVAEKLLGLGGLTLARSMKSRDIFEQSPPLPIHSAETLVGPLGLQNIRECVDDVLRNDVPGDLVETGVWRGGAAIYMRGILAARDDRSRTVWAADSYAGLPSPEQSRYPEDADDIDWTKESWLTVTLDEVKANFARYGLLDEQVQFLVGWFHDTLPAAPFDELSVIRLDGDMYGSTMDGLRYLYPKLSVGGYVIVDDYWLPKCRAAVDQYRFENDISDQLISVDRAIVYWQRTE
jgi:O-methyltransferase